jgi:hypothetical protein
VASVDHPDKNAARLQDAENLDRDLLRLFRVVDDAPGIDDVERRVWVGKALSVEALQSGLKAVA